MQRTTTDPTVDEGRRLAALHRFEILDTPPERVFDDLSRLAAQLCGTPISLLTLVDRDRQWFKARVNFDIQETPRDIAFCAHAIHQDELLVVPDALADDRFAANPLVLGDPNIRFYAGAPLVTDDGFELGTLCTIDRVPRELDAEQLEGLRTLARHATTLLDLRLRGRLYRRFLESAPDAIAVVDGAGRIRYANEPMARFDIGTDATEPDVTLPDAAEPGTAGHVAIEPDVTARRSFWELLDEPPGAPVRTTIADVIEGRRRGARIRAEFPTDDGRVPVSISVGAVELAGVTMAQLVARDISEEERARREKAALVEQLQRAERLRMVGQLAGGVAHNFNNLLTVIANSAELIRDAAVAHAATCSPAEDTTTTGVQGDAAQILHATTAAGRLTQQLLALAGRRSIDDGPADIATVVADNRQLFDRVAGDLVRLWIAVDADLPPVTANATEIEQMLLNLIGNARDAMPDGGHIRLEVSRTPRTQAPVPQVPLPAPQELIRCAVIDNGHGMSSEALAHATEPFFTTKGATGGTGLGLASVAAAVEAAGGVLRLASEAGQGTTVEVFLPPAEAEHRVRPVPPGPTQASTSSGRTLLVVDDDDAVLEMLERLLRRAGYQVEAADGAEAAIQAWRRLGGVVDAVITDDRMPGMTGTELARWLRAEDPGLPVVIISGMPAGVPIDRLPGPTPEMLDKPFTADSLFSTVERALIRGAPHHAGG